MNVYDQIYKSFGLSPTQQQILNLIQKGQTVLEIGAATGYMTKKLLAKKCIVDTVEFDKKAAQKIPRVRKKIIGSIENLRVINLLNRDYDYIIMADVVEHLVKPEVTLKKLRKICRNARLIISTPNIACWTIRRQLFFGGNFEYTESGILDKTHLHFYTVNTLPKVLASAGWKVERLTGGIIRVPLEQTIRKIPILGRLFDLVLRPLVAEKYKNLCYEHLLVIAK